MNASRARPGAFPRTPLLALIPWVVACVQGYPQRLPGPLVLPEAALEPAPPSAAGADAAAVTVQRNSDPVWVRRPGARGDYTLPFHRKRERVPLGTLVRTGAGGRAELLWSPDATTLALFDEGRVTLGDPGRDEPLLRFHSLTRALLVLTPEDRVELVGGALLAGDALETTGPILLESLRGSLLRITNQSKRSVTLACRDQRLELGPGESLDLPLLLRGCAPAEEDAEPQRFEVPGIALAFHGKVERRDELGAEGAGVTLIAQEPARVLALGVEVRLEARGTARFSGLSQVLLARPADPSAVPRSHSP